MTKMTWNLKCVKYEMFLNICKIKIRNENLNEPG